MKIGEYEQMMAYLDALEKLRQGDSKIALPDVSPELQPLNQAVQALADNLRMERLQARLSDQINTWANTGLVLEQVLENVYADLRSFIPYVRLGVSVIDPDGETVRAVWARSEHSDLALPVGYTAMSTLLFMESNRVIC